MLKRFMVWLKYQATLLPYRPRLFWDSLWVRKDEFHNSLHLNIDAMLFMNTKDIRKYLENIARRREIAHKRSLEEGTN